MEPSEFYLRGPDDGHNLASIRIWFPSSARKAGNPWRISQLSRWIDLMPQIVNVNLLKHPLNWVTIAIWVFILGYLIHIFSESLISFYPTSTSTGNLP